MPNLNKMIALLLLLLLITGCSLFIKAPAGKKLSELQTAACEQADKAGTCYSRLLEVGIVMPEDCCEVLKRCCKNE